MLSLPSSDELNAEKRLVHGVMLTRTDSDQQGTVVRVMESPLVRKGNKINAGCRHALLSTANTGHDTVEVARSDLLQQAAYDTNITEPDEAHIVSMN